MNIDFIVAFIAEEGVDTLLSDPSDVIELKAQKGLDFIRKIRFSSTEADIISLLHEYRYCDLEFIIASLEEKGRDVSDAIRRLEDYCCIERRDNLVSLSPPIRDAIRRDKRFSRSNEWLTMRPRN